MMTHVTQEGTAAGLTVDGVTFAGKTGTAEIGNPESYLRRSAVNAALDVVRARHESDTLEPERLPASGSCTELRELRDFVGKPHDSGSQMKMPPPVSQKKDAPIARSGETRREDGTPNQKK